MRRQGVEVLIEGSRQAAQDVFAADAWVVAVGLGALDRASRAAAMRRRSERSERCREATEQGVEDASGVAAAFAASEQPVLAADVSTRIAAHLTAPPGTASVAH
ncbi:MAG: hypothetical protein CVV14_10125 [Gammaproteobacteria bacterium HGW-Gammaproteobacteria-4]|jgi:hypothetical protein|nr:MAG: hypothetical protein CVV14_10125 [Gammaproteobacteria bacterium HGW-Gammaproteobacteria-4]